MMRFSYDFVEVMACQVDVPEAVVQPIHDGEELACEEGRSYIP